MLNNRAATWKVVEFSLIKLNPEMGTDWKPQGTSRD